MTSKEIKKGWEYVERLERRLDFLEARVTIEEVGAGKDLSYDKAEASALRWAVGIIRSVLVRESLSQ